MTKTMEETETVCYSITRPYHVSVSLFNLSKMYPSVCLSIYLSIYLSINIKTMYLPDTVVESVKHRSLVREIGTLIPERHKSMTYKINTCHSLAWHSALIG